MNLKKEIGKLFTSKFVGTGPRSYKKIIYRAAVSQSLRNTALEYNIFLNKVVLLTTLRLISYTHEDDTPKSYVRAELIYLFKQLCVLATY
jgi:hypothetical protein